MNESRFGHIDGSKKLLRGLLRNTVLESDALGQRDAMTWSGSSGSGSRGNREG